MQAKAADIETAKAAEAARAFAEKKRKEDVKRMAEYALVSPIV